MKAGIAIVLVVLMGFASASGASSSQALVEDRQDPGESPLAAFAPGATGPFAASAGGLVDWPGSRGLPDAPDALEDRLLDDRVIVGFQGDKRPMQGLKALADRFDARLERVDPVLAFAVLTVDPTDQRALIREASGLPGVAYAKPDALLDLYHTPNDVLYPTQWGPPAIGMEEAWDVTTGTHNVTVAVVDTGVAYDHEDLEQNVCEHGPDFGQGDDDPYDTYGHGTHVAGTVGAVIDNIHGVAGMSQSCILPVKIEAGGGLTIADAASGVQWSGDNGGDVIQMSWGAYFDPGPPLSTAISNAHAAGALLVAAAGNAGCGEDTVGFPAAYPQVMAVAALRAPGDQTAGFSSCGPRVEIAAPGESIMSTLPRTVFNPVGYGSASGTSMAAPHVSGVAALVWGERDDLDADELRCILRGSAHDLGTPGRDPATGFGRVDAFSALTEVCTSPPGAPEVRTFPWDEQVRLRWEPPYSGKPITGYTVYRGTDPDHLDPVASLPPGTTQFLDTGLTNGVELHYEVTATSTNGEGLPAQVSVTPRVPWSVPFQDDLESGAPGWSTEGEPGLWHLSQQRSESPTTSWYYGIEGDGHYDTGSANWGRLVSNGVDLDVALDVDETVVLSFWHWFEVEGSPYEHPVVQVSVDGGPWTTVWESGASHGEGAVSVDLGDFVGEKVRVAFFFDTLDGIANGFEGWYVDDVSLQVVEEVPSPPGPANDDFSDGFVVDGVPFIAAQSTGDATEEPGEPAPCGRIGSTVWYRFTAEDDRRVALETFDSSFDTVLAVYKGTALDDLQVVDCDDDTGGLQSFVALDVQQGETYHIQVGGFAGSSGDLVLNVQTPPENDDKADAWVIEELPHSDSQSTAGATTEPGEPAPCGGIGSTVWYRYDHPEDELSTSVTANTFGSGYDTVLAAYREVGGQLVQLDCNDDTGSLQSQVRFLAVPGETVYLQAGGFFGDQGTLWLNMDQGFDGGEPQEPAPDPDGPDPDETHAWQGMIGCSLNYPTAFQPWSCPDENNDNVHIFTIEPGLKTLAVAMDWEPVDLCTGEHLRHWLFVPADEARAAVRLEGPGPLEYRVDAGDSIELPFEEIEEPTQVRFQVWGPTNGFQFCYQQPFEVHYHLFYEEHAGDGYSALPAEDGDGS